MVESAFLRLLEMSRTAGFVILVVALARLLLRRSPKVFAYALWAAVLVRLLCPVSVKAAFSIVPGFKPIALRVRPVFLWVWAAGAAGMLIYSLVSYLRLRRKLRGAERLRGSVYEAEGVTLPFTLGFISPKIYLPRGLSEQDAGYVVLHERCHMRRGDNIIKLVSYLALCVHWFNPLVWLAFWLASSDMEMSCDEAVIRALGEDARADYSGSLLAVAVGKRRAAGLFVSFGGGDTVRRIRNLKNMRKPSIWLTVVTAVLCAALTGCLLTDREGTVDTASRDFPTESYTPRFAVMTPSTFTGDTVYYYRHGFDQILYYLDIDTGISMPLCGKPECKHSNASCNAWLDYCLGLQVYDGQLWFNSNDDICRMDLDGSNREKVLRVEHDLFYAGGGASGEIFFHRGYAFHADIASFLTNGEWCQGPKIYAQPLDEPEAEPIVILWDTYPQDTAVNAEFLPVGDWFYIWMTLWPNVEGPVSEHYRLYRWSLTTHELETVWEDDLGPDIYYHEIWVEDDTAFFFREALDRSGGKVTYTERSICSLDMTTGELTTRASLGLTGIYQLMGSRVVNWVREENGAHLDEEGKWHSDRDHNDYFITVYDLDGDVLMDTVRLEAPEYPEGEEYEDRSLYFSMIGFSGDSLWVEYDVGSVITSARISLDTGKYEYVGGWRT